MLMRSRIFVEKYKEALEYGSEGLKKFPESKVLKELVAKAKDEQSKEKQRIEEISTLKTVAQD